MLYCILISLLNVHSAINQITISYIFHAHFFLSQNGNIICCFMIGLLLDLGRLLCVVAQLTINCLQCIRIGLWTDNNKVQEVLTIYTGLKYDSEQQCCRMILIWWCKSYSIQIHDFPSDQCLIDSAHWWWSSRLDQLLCALSQVKDHCRIVSNWRMNWALNDDHTWGIEHNMSVRITGTAYTLTRWALYMQHLNPNDWKSDIHKQWCVQIHMVTWPDVCVQWIKQFMLEHFILSFTNLNHYFP